MNLRISFPACFRIALNPRVAWASRPCFRQSHGRDAHATVVKKPLRCVVGIVFLISATALANDRGTQTISNNLGWMLHVTPPTGDYQITTSHPDWTVGGSLGQAMNHATSGDGKDGIGKFSEIRFAWNHDGRQSAGIRLYRDRPIAVFSVTFLDGLDHSPTAFPILKNLPGSLMAFRYGNDVHLRPLSFQLTGKTADEQYGGPFCLFDHDANAMVLSPASNFMVAMLSGDQSNSISSGLNRTLKSVPTGYTQQTILAIAPGINQTWAEWGHALTDLYEKKRPANDADVGLKYLSYWTDNGAAYYYNYDLDKGYANTLLAVKEHLERVGVPIHSMQLDSWWYPKTFNSVERKSSNKPHAKDPRLPAGTWNRYGGLLTYTPSPDLFPQGLKAFDEKLGLPLITHNRWIDPTSPYWQNYKISGIAAVDPKWWDKIIGDIASWGVVTYEQDWNNYIYNLSPELSSTTWAGDAYLDGMARACAAHGLTMQYCMIIPRVFLQGGAKYSNLTTARLSDDRFDRSRWRDFVYGSQFASALGVWPWADVFRSRETANILLADLSAGMVGLSDKIGEEDLDNIFHVARRDGVIVKPDEPLIPMDQTFIAQAKGKKTPLICAAHSGDTQYVFAFNPKQGNGDDSAEFSPDSLGLHGNVFVYDWFAAKGRLVDTKENFSQHLNEDDWAYDVICPVGKSGMAFIGDLGLFATDGSQRIASVKEKQNRLRISLLLAPNEKDVTIGLYAPAKPAVTVKNGTCQQLDYDPASGLVRARIAINPASKSGGSDSTKTMRVEFALQ